MVGTTQCNPVLNIGAPVTEPFFDVVDVAVGNWSRAGGCLASFITCHDGPSLCGSEEANSALLIEHCVWAMPDLSHEFTITR